MEKDSDKDVAWSDMPGAVKHLNATNFSTELKQLDAALVMFYAPWCRYCKMAQPEFQNAADSLKTSSADSLTAVASHALAAVDCDEDRDFCRKAGVRGYPTFKLYLNGKYYSDFNGARSKDEFMHYLQNAARLKDNGVI